MALARAFGGEHREHNLHPLLLEHHKKKTSDDVAIKSYSYRRKLAHAGELGPFGLEKIPVLELQACSAALFLISVAEFLITI